MNQSQTGGPLFENIVDPDQLASRTQCVLIEACAVIRSYSILLLSHPGI